MKRLAVLLSLSTLLVSNALADEGKHPKRHGPGDNPIAHGLPGDIAAKLGISAELQKQVQDATFEANRNLVDLDAAKKKAHMDLDRELRNPAPDENKVMQLAMAANQAELAARKNRLSLLLKTRKILGAETWGRLIAELEQPASAPSKSHGR